MEQRIRRTKAMHFRSGRSSSATMERVASDDLQTITRHRSPPRSPFLSALWRRQSKTNTGSQGKFKEERRIIVFGAAKVGKSTIVKQFLFDQFTKKYIKTVEDLYVADYNLSSGESLRLEILDTTGSYQFPAMRSLSISNGHAFLLVYSVDNEDSWKEIENLRRQIIYVRGPDVPIVIAGNIFEDNGNERMVERDMVEKTVKRWRCGYIECNAKENVKIVEVFEKILNQSNIEYDLIEAVSRRRRSFPVYSDKQHSDKHRIKQTNQNACKLT